MNVDCDFRKWPDRQHWRFPARFVDRDAYGTWLVTEPPCPYDGPQGVGEWNYTMFILVPHNDWWIATFYANEPGLEAELYVDICSPATWHTSRHVQSIDLDLDVIRFRDGTVLIDDEDEFLEHQVAYGYPADVISEARSACDRIVTMVTERAEPFGLVGAEKLARIIVERC